MITWLAIVVGLLIVAVVVAAVVIVLVVVLLKTSSTRVGHGARDDSVDSGRSATAPLAMPASSQSFRVHEDGKDIRIDVRLLPRATGRVDHFTELRIVWPDESFRCEIYPESSEVQRRSLPGMENLSGDADSGSHFAVQANDPDKAERLLSDAVQSQINQLYRFSHGHDIYVAIAGGVMVVRKLGQFQRDSLRRLTRMVAALHDQALVAAESAMTMLGEAANDALDTAICEICGEAIDYDVVLCSRCKTPHHRDCWEYYGACSIYACGEKTYERPNAPIHSQLQPKRIPRARGRYRGA